MQILANIPCSVDEPNSEQVLVNYDDTPLLKIRYKQSPEILTAQIYKVITIDRNLCSKCDVVVQALRDYGQYYVDVMHNFQVLFIKTEQITITEVKTTAVLLELAGLLACLMDDDVELLDIETADYYLEYCRCALETSRKEHTDLASKPNKVYKFPLITIGFQHPVLDQDFRFMVFRTYQDVFPFIYSTIRILQESESSCLCEEELTNIKEKKKKSPYFTTCRSKLLGLSELEEMIIKSIVGSRFIRICDKIKIVNNTKEKKTDIPYYV